MGRDPAQRADGRRGNGLRAAPADRNDSAATAAAAQGGDRGRRRRRRDGNPVGRLIRVSWNSSSESAQAANPSQLKSESLRAAVRSHRPVEAAARLGPRRGAAGLRPAAHRARKI